MSSPCAVGPVALLGDGLRQGLAHRLLPLGAMPSAAMASNRKRGIEEALGPLMASAWKQYESLSAVVNQN